MKVKIPYKLTQKQHEAMVEEIDRQIAERNLKNSNGFDAAVLWSLHICEGFGQKRLRRFYDTFRGMMTNSSKWMYGRTEIELLKGIGVDIEAWNAEDNK